MSWTEIGSVASESSKHTRYAIAVSAEGDLSCKCMSWTHSKEVPKVCKHVTSAEAGKLLRAYQASRVPVPWRLQTIGQRTYIGLGQYGVLVPTAKGEDLERLVASVKALLDDGYGYPQRAALVRAMTLLGVLVK